MTFFVIFLALLLIVYIISYSNRDKSKDYLTNTSLEVSRSESDFIYETQEAIELQIEHSKKSNSYVQADLILAKEKMMNNIPNLCIYYKVDKLTARMVINSCFDKVIIKEVKNNSEELFKKFIEKRVNEIIDKVTKEHNSSNWVGLSLSGDKRAAIRNADVYAEEYNLSKETVIKITEEIYLLNIRHISKNPFGNN